MDTSTQPDTYLARFGARASQGLAARLSRRSFIAKVGGGAVAIALGSELVFPALAAAAESETCANLTGSNSCPSGTCHSGCWTIQDSSHCSTSCNQLKCWCDCQDQGSYCANNPWGGCHTFADGSVTCCNDKRWSGGCSTGLHTVCRRSFCFGACGGSCGT